MWNASGLGKRAVADGGERVQIEKRDEWRAWLQDNHERGYGVWVVTFKKHCGARHVPYEIIIEEALCFGWIDSLPRALDDERTMRWFAPRKPGSGWSALNKARVEKMIAEGRMAAPGLEKVRAAERDGSWNALDAVDALAMPGDLQKALAGHDPARRNFDGFPRSVRRGILEWIASAKTPETRARRVRETARSAKNNVRANQWR